MIRTIKDIDVRNKRVLLRCDFNVPLDDKGEVQDDFRIRQTLPTIKYLISQKARIVMMSHLGKPKGRVAEELRLTPVQRKIREISGIPVLKADDCIGKKVEKQVSKLKEGEVLLLENLRFHKEEEENDEEFAKELAKLGDVYINDAFGACHRNHASITKITKFLPSAAGLLLEKEVKILSRVLENPWRPLVSIIGGAKIESKTKLIKKLLEKSDHLLIGGKIANAILAVKGLYLSSSWPEDKEIVKEIEGLQLTSTKIHIPIDVLASPDKSGETYVRFSAAGKVRNDELLLDIGPETVDIFGRIIEEAKMIVWSGPMGLFENPLFEKGTKGVAEKILRNHKAYKIVGGGDTNSALLKLGLLDKFDHVSTGGGAMLCLLSGDKLPGLEVLEKTK